MGAMVLAVALFFENRMLDERARLAARQLTVLSDAAASHVSGRFPAMLTAIGGGSFELTPRPHFEAPARSRPASPT